MAYKDFAPAQILTAQEVDTYLMRQTVMSFATATARDAAITTPTEGMVAYLEDSNTFWFYNGAAWQNLGSVMRFASAAARTTALPSPAEGMVSYLQDIDELQVYDGASWLTVVVTGDDDNFATTGSITANTGGADGGFALRSYTGAGGYQSLATANMTGSEYVIATDGGDTYISAGTGNQVYIRPSANSTTGQVNINTTNTTTTGNLVVTKRNPVLQIEETGGADNVDINLYQSGSSTEGLQIRYESGTGHSRIKNIYSAGSLFLHSANSTSTGLEIDSSGRNRVVQNFAYSRAGQMVGTARAVAGSRATTSSTFSVGGTWTTLASQSVLNSTINANYVAVHFYFSCYVTTAGNCRSKIVIRYGGTDWQIAEAYHYFNPTYQHMMWHNNAILQVPGGLDYDIWCQVYGFTTLNFNGDDSYGFVAFAA